MSKRVLLFVTGGTGGAVPPADPSLLTFSEVKILEGGTWDAENNAFIPGTELDGKEVWILDLIDGGNVSPSPESPQGCAGEAFNGTEGCGFQDQGRWMVGGFARKTLTAGVPVTLKAAAESFGPATALQIFEA